MFSTIFGFGYHIFITLVLLLTAGITAHLCYGYGTYKAKETYIMLILLLMIGTQMYYLINAATYIPASRFYTYNENLHRTDCLESHKGGKRPSMSIQLVDRNPCYCLSSIATCTRKATGAVVSNASCPYDQSVICENKYNKKRIKPFHSRKRDCSGGQGTTCTFDQPCTPCELAKVMEFNSTRCRTCSTDFKGNCNFVPNYGPYCWQSVNSLKVVPCTQCCTEPRPLITKDGLCF